MVPLSCEYILVEDQRRPIRFERACPSPVWWYEHTQQELGHEGGTISRTETPDVEVQSSRWVNTERTVTVRLQMVTAATFADYTVAIWYVPAGFRCDLASTQTNAKECLVVWSRDRECHLVLFFELEPGVELRVNVATAPPPKQGFAPPACAQPSNG